VRQLLTPRFIVLHVLVLAVVAVLVQLGTWQLARHEEASELVQAQEERFEQAPAPVGTILDGLELDDTEQLAELEFRQVTATGTWRPADEVLQRGRSLQGRSGFHVLTPLDLDGGGTVLVRRGWVPFDNDLRPPVTDAAPPDGAVEVQGYLERSIPQPTGPLSQRDPAEGGLDIVFHADVGRLAGQLGGDVLPMLVHMEGQVPPQVGELPVTVPRPAPDRGPHLSYAIQWFSFAVIAVGMYGLWQRRRASGDERAVSAEVGAND
jgi:surfeit locus 1 family protein